ncbi:MULTISPECIES: CBS domain-containing protein [Haloarcula]|uniref:CBS domain-containing protein n=1 Tax=Haloarcula hispanica TaxID=51589 RepID=A0A5J5LI10_HALHI|nr:MULTISPECIES: CBS domain-containing protein [Haloarcula]AJF26475.1 histidine kinase [Haloarcula sp. CBA1115]KAA9407701.1 CBS domain-containing protein [Haloarcula sp. CBA1131]KAA9409254.1 CBS domain-containing protein [Haloarcula hispanica]KZX48195.1 histidine kinase [Haloarcula sp. K1]
MDDVFVGRIMSSPVTTVAADANAKAVAKRMLDENISSVVVVDADGALLGILTSTDFVEIAAEGGDTTALDVSDFMTTEPVTVTANDPIEAAASLMLDHSVHHLPVVDETEGVVGMLTTTDMTAYVSGIEQSSAPVLS